VVVDNSSSFSIFLVVYGESGCCAAAEEGGEGEAGVQQRCTFPKADVSESELCSATPLHWVVVRVFANTQEVEECNNAEIGFGLRDGIRLGLRGGL
jgi:hypothetical protein